MTLTSTRQPDWACPPGTTVLRVLNNKQISLSVFADQIDLSLDEVNSLLSGETQISDDIANRLADVFGNSAAFWLNREKQYRLSLLQKNSGIDAHSIQPKKWCQKFPRRDMEKFGWIENTSSKDEFVEALFDFFDVPDVHTWYRKYSATLAVAAFRTTNSYVSDPFATITWLRSAELMARRMDCGAWNRGGFEKSLSEIRKLTTWKEPHSFIPKLQQICARCGVAVVIEPAPKGCRASGATQFLSEDRAMLVLSLRYKSDDHFWFTFFHEAGHLMLHGREALFLEDGSEVTEVEEQEANEFAEKIIIPQEYDTTLYQLTSRSKAIIRFSVRIGVSPGLVVGQMQHRELLTFGQMNHLKRRFEWVDRKA